MNYSILEEGVLICLSKACNDSDKTFLYMWKLEDHRIGEGDPVQLINPRGGMNAWTNTDVRRENLSFGEIVKFRIVENKYIYNGKTRKRKMVSNPKLQTAAVKYDIDLALS